MRVLLVTNLSAPRCGIQNFGVQTATALRRAGAEVTEWDGTYQAIYEKPYLPDDAASYDVIHFNWHPVTINHYTPDHFPAGPILSVYLNDLPPWSSCPVFDRAAVRFSAEDHPGCLTLPYPIADWVTDPPDSAEVFTVGWSGVRGDGAKEIAHACKELGYQTNAPDGVWRSFEEEVRRLARSSVNVCWYHEERGISGGASQVAAARRPMILNGSPMFRHFHPYSLEFYFERSTGRTATLIELPALLVEAYADWKQRRMIEPCTILKDLSWSTAATRMLEVWSAAR